MEQQESPPDIASTEEVAIMVLYEGLPEGFEMEATLTNAYLEKPFHGETITTFRGKATTSETLIVERFPVRLF